MGQYSKELQILMDEVYVMEDDFSEKFQEIIKMFQLFPQRLTTFIKDHGYEGDFNDLQAKIQFMKLKFKENHIPIHRHIEKWFKGEKEISRETAFKICMALNLTPQQSEHFFRKVMLERGFDYHNIKEAIYYFALKQQLSYQEVEMMIGKTPKVKNDQSIPFETTIVYTDIIKNAIDQFDSKEQLLNYLEENKQQFTYNNVSAITTIKTLWEMIAKEDGYANREYMMEHGEKRESRQSNFKLYQQLLNYDDVMIKKIKSDRSLLPLFKDNKLIHPYVAKVFPSRQTLENILRGEHVEYEGIRKMLIFLLFYRFWVTIKLNRNQDTYYKVESDEQRCFDTINRFLVDVGYPTLYIGNPYDFIFIWASYDESPLSCFQLFMGEVFLMKEELF